MTTTKHYQDFFKLDSINEDDKLHIDWGEALIEDYKTERAKGEPSYEELSAFKEKITFELIEKYSKIDIIRPKSKKDGFTKEKYIEHIISEVDYKLIGFLLDYKKRNDKEFAESIKIPIEEIQAMIDEAIENTKLNKTKK